MVEVTHKGKYFTPRVSKEPVVALIRTHDYLITGSVYTRPEQRLKDELNSDRERFLAVTEAQVYDPSGEQLLFESSFLLIAYDHIVLITPTDAITATSGDAPAYNGSNGSNGSKEDV